jgi:hypothetical protein
VNETDEQAERYFQAFLMRLLRKSTMKPGGCWIWNGWTNHKGYGQTSYEGYNVFIHRKVFELAHCRLLKTEEFVCHTCDTRRCWNPAHLFVGDAKTNNNDCASKGRHHNAVKTHCKFGHEYTEDNIVWKIGEKGNRMRGCKTCIAIGHRKESYLNWRREYQKRRRAEERGAKQETSV